ncbi:chaperone modulator CbpM [Lutibacter sp. TH_r2]|uniref:chaperone modulator CbpM n=1 Tax=Lutibacter sp. TH_r2 TaxID=3082083 RepID=UPI002954A659|nr:chaperone modulator CbpM [Lutibacter sp. TH_r2]MDV7186073.1 chaperone modulator CbpM [Lutibacter sp. TH_r2]
MATQDLILIDELCVHYKIELSFFEALDNVGLIKIERVEQNKFIHQDIINDLEKMIRLHNELNVNIEGIDIVFNLLKKEMKLQEEVIYLKNKLRLYEDNL